MEDGRLFCRLLSALKVEYFATIRQATDIAAEEGMVLLNYVAYRQVAERVRLLHATIATGLSIGVMVSSFEPSVISLCRLFYHPKLASNTCS